MNSFAKTKDDKSQKEEEDRRESSFAPKKERRQKEEEEEDKGTVVVPQEAIEWFFSMLFMHSRACDYRLLLYSRPRMLSYTNLRATFSSLRDPSRNTSSKPL